MKKNKYLISALSLLISFIIFTVLLLIVDRRPIGPNNSIVGFASINEAFESLVGVHMTLYTITDWGAIGPTIIGFVFATTGLCQWIKRKSILKVDKEILALGIFYIIVFIFFLVFNFVVINYRPVLIEGVLESSYPSSTTFMSITFLMTMIILLDKYVKNRKLNITIKVIGYVFMAFLIVGRLLSGVHWLTDIIGSVMIGCMLVLFFLYTLEIFNEKK